MKKNSHRFKNISIKLTFTNQQYPIRHPKRNSSSILLFLLLLLLSTRLSLRLGGGRAQLRESCHLLVTAFASGGALPGSADTAAAASIRPIVVVVVGDADFFGFGHLGVAGDGRKRGKFYIRYNF